MVIYCLIILLVFRSIGMDDKQQEYPLKPARLTMQMPPKGFVWLDDEEFTGRCDKVPASNWEKFSAADFDLLVYTDGPSGSGHYWTVTVAMKSKTETRPRRGFCLSTSTVGWITLPQPTNFSLSWIEDRDGDGKPELIIWDSFPLREEATNAEYGLIGWVYQVDKNGLCTIDWNLTRKLAGDIAEAYQQSSGDTDPVLRNLSLAAADVLHSFATHQCIPSNP
jgi:hypothetical protein